LHQIERGKVKPKGDNAARNDRENQSNFSPSGPVGDGGQRTKTSGSLYTSLFLVLPRFRRSLVICFVRRRFFQAALKEFNAAKKNYN